MCALCTFVFLYGDAENETHVDICGGRAAHRSMPGHVGVGRGMSYCVSDALRAWEGMWRRVVLAEESSKRDNYVGMQVYRWKGSAKGDDCHEGVSFGLGFDASDDARPTRFGGASVSTAAALADSAYTALPHRSCPTGRVARVPRRRLRHGSESVHAPP